MTPIDNVVNRVIERFRPDVVRACNHTISYANSVTCLLQDILEAVRSEEYDVTRVRIPITVSDGSEDHLVQLPTNEEWTLELVSVLCDAAVTVILRESGSFRWVHQFNTSGSETEIDLVLFGGNTVTVESVTGDGTSAEMFFQFTKRVPRLATGTPFTGMDSTGIDVDLENETYRHVSTVPIR